MVKSIKYQLVVVIAVILIAITFPQIVLGSYEVNDKADLFYSYEISDIENLAKEISTKYGMNVYILTDNSRNEKKSADKIEEAYEDAGYCDNDAKGGIGLIIDMASREVNLVTERDMMYYITDNREEEIYDSGYGYLSNGEYGDAMIAMMEVVLDFLKQGVPGNQYLYDEETGRIVRYKSITVFDFLLAFITAIGCAVAVCITIAVRYTKVKNYRYDINRNAKMNITNASERLVNQFVTRRHIPKDPPVGTSGSGGRTTVHHSSSGKSFGGGSGRKF